MDRKQPVVILISLAMCGCLNVPASEQPGASRFVDIAVEDDPFAPVEVNPGESKSSPDVARYAMELLTLEPHDLLAEIGCGDAEHLIHAVQTYGCRGIGIEINTQLADEARRNVRAAGLEGRIEIFTMDARLFDYSEVTAVYVYLFPGLLAELAPKLKGPRPVASPYHEIEGLDGRPYKDIWLYGYDWRTYDQPNSVDVQRYLVTSPTCVLCGPAKGRFLAAGNPPENVISVQEAWNRFGLNVTAVPYEFTRTTQKQSARVQTQERPYAIWNGQIYYSRWCNQSGCGMCNDIQWQLDTFYTRKREGWLWAS